MSFCLVFLGVEEGGWLSVEAARLSGLGRWI